MEVKVSLKDAEGSENLRQFTEDLIRACAEKVQLPLAALNEVVVADDDNFGPCIHRLQDESGIPRSFTSNSAYVACAKVIPLRRGGTLTTSIVLRHYTVGLMYRDLAAGGNFDDGSVEGQLFYYVICHELGHCKDHQIRNAAEASSEILNGKFKIQTVTRYYRDILQDEVAACLLSGHCMTPKVYEHELEETNGTIQQVLEEVKKHRYEYYADNSKLSRLAYSASGAFWLILVQYSKLVASATVNTHLPATLTPLWTSVDESLLGTIENFSVSIRARCAEYPNWSRSGWSNMETLWREIAIAHYYEFIEGEPDDSLYLRHPAWF